MRKGILTTLVLFFLAVDTFSQSLPPNAILKNYRPFETPRTNGRPGEVYRIDENEIKYIVQDIKQIKEKVSDEGDLVGRMYFTSGELLALLNLEFDRVEIVPVEVKISKAKREYTEQTTVDKVLYENGMARELIKDPKSRYYLIRETILTKDITFRFSPDIVKKIKRGATALVQNTANEVDFPFEIQKKFKKEKRIFYLDQPIEKEPYDD